MTHPERTYSFGKLRYVGCTFYTAEPPVKCTVPEYGAFANVVVIGGVAKGNRLLLRYRATSQKNQTLIIGRIGMIEPHRLTLRGSSVVLQQHQWFKLLKVYQK